MKQKIKIGLKQRQVIFSLTLETMKSLESSKSKITKENVPLLEITEIALYILILLTIIINKICQKSCIHLFLISHLVNYQKIHQKKIYFQKPFDSEFPYIEVLFTDQNSKPPKIEDKINIPLVIN